MVRVTALTPGCDDADTGAMAGTRLPHLAAVMPMCGQQRGPDCSARLQPCQCRAVSASGLLNRLHIYAMHESTPSPWVSSTPGPLLPRPTMSVAGGRDPSHAVRAPLVPGVITVCLECYCGDRV
jgi:hypothetical protein